MTPDTPPVMGFHTYDVDSAERLEAAADRYRYLSAEELRGALDPAQAETILDIGSGTGFYTDDIAPHARHVIALDLQPGMHAYYRTKGVPDSVTLVTGAANALPVGDAEVDKVVSTMTYHEFASDTALSEIKRVLTPGGRLVIADWSATGSGDAGPPTDERYTLAAARAAVSDAGFVVEALFDRPETFLVVASLA